MITAPSQQTFPAIGTPRSQKTSGAIFAIFLLMGGGFFYFLALRPFVQSRTARNWVETPCRIVSSEVKSSHDSNGTTYRPEIHYVYKLQGREYQGDRYQFLRFSSSGRASKAAAVRRTCSSSWP